MHYVKDSDFGLKKILQEIKKAAQLEVAVGILEGSKKEAMSIASYAASNEFGTKNIPARPFMAMSFDENIENINNDFNKHGSQMLQGKINANSALTIIGQKHASRIQNTITNKDIAPKLSNLTVKKKKGSTKTLVDTGAMVNAVQISIRGRG